MRCKDTKLFYRSPIRPIFSHLFGQNPFSHLAKIHPAIWPKLMKDTFCDFCVPYSYFAAGEKKNLCAYTLTTGAFPQSICPAAVAMSVNANSVRYFRSLFSAPFRPT